MDPNPNFELKRSKAFRGVPRNGPLTSRDVNSVWNFIRAGPVDPAEMATLEARLLTRLPVTARSPPRVRSTHSTSTVDATTSVESSSGNVSGSTVVDPEEQAPESSQSPGNGDSVPELDSSSSPQSIPDVLLDNGGDDDETSSLFLPSCCAPCSTPWSAEFNDSLRPDVDASKHEPLPILQWAAERAAQTVEAERAERAEQYALEDLLNRGQQ